jgi:hypothetical protein
MTERKWLPTDYQDEAIPPPLASPNDWIGQLSDGRFFLKSPDPLDRGDVCGRPLKDGDVVEFDWTEPLGWAQLTKLEDGYALDREEPAAPADATLTCWEPGDADTISECAEDLADNLDPGDEITVGWFCWSMRSVTFVFNDGQFVERQSTP